MTAMAAALILFLHFCSGCDGEDASAEAARSLAEANGLAEEDVSVKISSVKANYCEAVFRKIPADGMFRLTEETLRKRIPQAPLFLHVSVPGGDVAELIACPFVRSIEHAGTEPIVCSGTANPLRPGAVREIQLIDWTMNDLKELSRAVDEHVLLDVVPRGGAFDWRTLREFPFMSWRIRNAVRWEGTEVDLRLSLASLTVSGDSVVLPKRSICRNLYLDACKNIDFNGVVAEETRTLFFDADAFDPGELKRFPHLESVAVASRKPLSCKVFSGLKELFSIRIDGCAVEDCKELRNLPLLYSAHFTNCRIDEEEFEVLSKSAERMLRTENDGILVFFR